MQHSLALVVLLCCWRVTWSFCPSQCTCVFHGTSVVLCNNPDMSDIPTNVPLDTVKLRVEKTAVRKLKTETFYYLTELRYLWLSYNSISTVDPGSFYNLKVLHELCLDGNQISKFPWEALKEMPNLRTLDLHNNQLTSIPSEAAVYLMNITYLDISSNKLNTLPSDLLDIWSPFSDIPIFNAPEKIILGLQDNLWYCDCQISKLIKMSKMAIAPVVLMDTLVSCSGPENLAGVLFKRAELDKCVKPTIMTSATTITSSIGSNVLLRCDATGYPTPTLLWSKEDGSPLSNPVVQKSPDEGVRWSVLSLQGIMLKDAGVYRCRAKNVAGNSEASVTLSVAGMDTTTLSLSLSMTKKPEESPAMVIQASPPATEIAIPIIFSSTTFTTKQAMTTRQTVAGKINSGAGGGIPRIPPTEAITSKIGQSSNGKRPVTSDKARRKGNPFLKDIEVIEETGDTAVVIWKNEGFPSDSPLFVHYFPYDGDQIMKETIETKVGNGKLVLDDLFPDQIYTVCLVSKGGKDQCVNFSTLDIIMDDGQNKWLTVIGGMLCAFAFPLILILLYKISSLYCKWSSSNNRETNNELFKETYVKFETLPMKQRTLCGSTNDLWSRRQTHESERMLLCSRSSIDSQMTYKSDSSQFEYLC
ncbi:leucine-rich repeat, immunoglobulin-like domain and transmembrane domain-containing protein 3a [Trichomycterus rosablanca]|uniref:leucine-rich repeat, immunoglobulin-like domain and transmembrane domain-containing protein 3a n=1 Tax=Trichomycterus rosablanca TaxID=2290929 RepID=UPI002F356E29